jgi:hypothetical protein
MYLNKGEVMKRYILAGTAVLAFVLTVIFVFGRSSAGEIEHRGFYGSITYNNCDCTDGAYADQVYIKKLPSGPIDNVGVSCYQGVGSYDTEASNQLVFEPGDYQLWVGFNPSGPSECETSAIQQVKHQYGKQQVDLTVYGPGGGGS